jgi:polyphenol oxidase
MLKNFRSANNVQYFTLDPLEQVISITHAFSTRLTQNNVQNKGGYEEEKNRSLLCQTLNINPGKLILGKQVHGNKVAAVKGKMKRIMADALVTDQPGLALAVLTADCLPIIIIDKNRPSVGIAHAGRQGTLLRIAAHTLIEMIGLFKTNPRECLVGIGPGIGPCCYEIPEDLARPFQESFTYWREILRGKRAGFFILDLIKANQLQFIELGVKEKNIFTTNLCTCCHPELFYSYRREKRESRRQLNLVMVREPLKS